MSATERLPERWYLVEQEGKRFKVKAASRKAAAYYLRRCLADHRPYEPGTYIKPWSATRT